MVLPQQFIRIIQTGQILLKISNTDLCESIFLYDAKWLYYCCSVYL